MLLISKLSIISPKSALCFGIESILYFIPLVKEILENPYKFLGNLLFYSSKALNIGELKN